MWRNCDTMDMKQEEVTTLHNIRINEKELIKNIRDISSERRIAIIMPMLYEELGNRSIGNIAKGLNKCDYAEEILIPLSAKSEGEFRRVKRFFSTLKIPKPTRNISTRIRAIRTPTLPKFLVAAPASTWVALMALSFFWSSELAI